jgi:glycyl-tRNA synthetase
MLELDTTIMTPSIVFETSGHVARFADWMVKDTKTGEVLRADHLVKNVLEARLAGDKEARGQAALPQGDDKDKKKKKRAAVGKAAAVQLSDEDVKQYQSILAQVGLPYLSSI